MRKIDWVRKLTSHRLWDSIASFVSILILVMGGSKNTAVQIAALIMGGAKVMASIIGEGLTSPDAIDTEASAQDATEKPVYHCHSHTTDCANRK